MIPRYSHPDVTALWSPLTTYSLWLMIERQALGNQIHLGLIPEGLGDPLLEWLINTEVDQAALDSIEAIERRTKHDVAAFLEWLRSRCPDNGQWLHFGLTSSDLVDTTQAIRFRRLHSTLTAELNRLVDEVSKWTRDMTPMLGYTHGQPAEPTSMSARAHHWLATLRYPIEQLTRLTRQMRVMKLSGPVGTFAHNPPELEVDVAVELGLIPCGPGASQVVPRSVLALWASAAGSLAASCAKIAMDVRLMNHNHELVVGWGEGQVGSSAMPHKHNPIQAEKISGLARLAAGYASMLQPLDLWLERDISHSSVERVAVPDLWHVLFHTIQQTTMILDGMVLSETAVEINLEDRANAAWSHKTTLDAIRDGMKYGEARDLGREFDMESYNVMGDAGWFMRQYPGNPK